MIYSTLKTDCQYFVYNIVDFSIQLYIVFLKIVL